jgi:hypothetical protein
VVIDTYRKTPITSNAAPVY